MSGKSPVTHLSDMVDKYRDFRRVVIQQARQAVTDLRHKTTQWELRSSEWLSQAELAVNDVMQSAQQTVSAHVQRVVDYTQTLLAGFSVLGNTVEGWNIFDLFCFISRLSSWSMLRKQMLQCDFTVKMIDKPNQNSFMYKNTPLNNSKVVHTRSCHVLNENIRYNAATISMLT